MSSTMTVTVQPGIYVVTEVTRHSSVQVYFVTRDKRCSCGGDQQCRHVMEVAKYLQGGGKRAPERHSAPASETPNPVPQVCPICGDTILLLDSAGARPLWRCRAAPSHYWRWRGESSGVRAFLTQPHLNKVGAFYGQSPEQRSAFLATARRQMFAGGYSPH